MSRGRVAAVAGLVGCALALVAGEAAAYPHYQFTSGTDRCSECHLAPAGGGLINDWGRSELGDTLSMGGDGRFLHRLDTPAWLVLGGDLRLAALVNDTGSADGAEVAVFPMQAEAAARVGGGALSATVVAGARAAARDTERPDDGGGGFHGLAFFLREHLITYAPSERWQVRAGRFAAPFGLRLADHTAFVRRYLGYGVYDETYGVGLSLLRGAADLHVTAFVADVVQAGAPLAGGVAALYERRWAATALMGSARITAGEAAARGVAGLAVKRWLPGSAVLLMAEVDGGWEQLTDAGAGRALLAVHAGPTWIPRRGVNLALAGEVFAEDVRVVETNRYAGSLALSVLPWAHVEVVASGRYQRVGSDAHATLAMIQLHYMP